MSLTNYPNGVSTFGNVPVLPNLLGIIPTGSVFFVKSSTGTDAPGNGKSISDPFASIDYAVGRCTADNGDVIVALPGHAETVSAADGIDLDVAGISVIGAGQGSNRPTITFSSSASAQLQVDAANITVANLLFVANVASLVNPINVNAADFTMKNCETRDFTSQATDFIVTTANADRMAIDGWKHLGGTAAGSASAISIVGGDNISIQNFQIDGNFSAAAIENVTTATSNLQLGSRSVGNTARTRNAADVIFTAVATSTGFVDNIFSRLADNAANITEALVGADMQFGPNLPIVNADGEQAIQWNGAASTDA